ncbi:outer envelope membrane protein 7 [Quercus suber]|uniref:Outer envelope membrane protein 7 n=1 Tax=Quercus suber TaxID=58331 RepID=A0AAW0KX51_QUESU
MAAITSALIAIAGVVLGWIAIEIACKPCLEQGREAIDRSLNPDYDPDDAVSNNNNNNNIRSPLITSESDDPVVVVASSTTSYDSSVKPI